MPRKAGTQSFKKSAPKPPGVAKGSTESHAERLAVLEHRVARLERAGAPDGLRTSALTAVEARPAFRVTVRITSGGAKSAMIDHQELTLAGVGQTVEGTVLLSAGRHVLGWAAEGAPRDFYAVVLTGDTTEWRRDDLKLNEDGLSFGGRPFLVPR